MRHSAIVFQNPVDRLMKNDHHIVKKYSTKAKDYVTLFEGSWKECMEFLGRK